MRTNDEAKSEEEMDVILGLEKSGEGTMYEDERVLMNINKVEEKGESSAMDNKVFEKDEGYESHMLEEAVTESNRGE